MYTREKRGGQFVQEKPGQYDGPAAAFGLSPARIPVWPEGPPPASTGRYAA